MATWIKAFFQNSLHQGSLFTITDYRKHQARKCVFLNATWQVRRKEVEVKNLDFDILQGQEGGMRFKICECSGYAYYAIEDEEAERYCLKWVYSGSGGKQVYGFEFSGGFDPAEISRALGVQITKEEDRGTGKNPLENTKTSLRPTHGFSKEVPVSQLYLTSMPDSNIDLIQLPPSPTHLVNTELDSQLQFKLQAIKNLSHIYRPEQILFLSAGDLYLKENLTDQGIGLVLARHDQFSVTLDIIRDNELIMRILLSQHFYYKIDKKHKYLDWVEYWESETRHWSAHLMENLTPLEDLLTILLFEAERKEQAIQALTAEDLDWLRQEQNPENSSEDKTDSEDSFGATAEETVDIDITDSVQSLTGQEIYAGSLNTISVFSEVDSTIKLLASVPIVNPFEGEGPFSPQMLLPRDQGLLMVNEYRPSHVYAMDLCKGKIKSSYNISKAPIKAISDSKKLGSCDYLAMTHNSILNIDPRSPNYIVQNYCYSKSPKLSGLATTCEGHIAVGSDTGQIRLYTRTGQKAKTCFPGFGHKIYAIDCTRDGKWLVATCETYLVVLPTEAYGVDGFKKSITKKRRKARQLQLSPADIARMGIAEVRFTPARFNVGADLEENAIITSTGNVLVIWNFKAVKLGKIYNYKARAVAQNVIKNEFLYGKDEAVLTYRKGIEVQYKGKGGGV